MDPAAQLNGSGPGVVMAGGGLAAQRCCETLRARGYEGRIRVVCAEHEPPYDRPPLSKEVLAGDVPDEEVHLRSRDWYAENEVELLLGRRAVRLDSGAARLALDGGEALDYERLLIATGSEPRHFPAAAGFSNVHALRTLHDARRLAARLRRGSRLLVIGAGFIGQEVAASARRLGVEVTLVEAAVAPLSSVVGLHLGQWFANFHREEGVDVRLSTQVTEFRGNGRVEEVELTGGERVACDEVLVGIGVKPSTDWLEGSGLEPDGVRVDFAGRTAAPLVYAAGDVALAFDPRLGTHVRTEHWESAAAQGAAAARGMLGLAAGRARLPAFWSDQHGVRIQHLGHMHSANGVTVEGDLNARDFVAVYTRGDRAVAALLVGRPHALPEMRRRIDRDANEAVIHEGSST